jgi:hypothetical protein
MGAGWITSRIGKSGGEMMKHFRLDSQQFPAAMIESDDGEWLNVNDAQPVHGITQLAAHLVIEKLRNDLAAMTAKRDEWEALATNIRNVYEKSTEAELLRNDTLEFAAKECEEVGLMYLNDQMVEECAAAFRLFIAAPKELTP